MGWRTFDGARAANGALPRRSWAAFVAPLIAVVLLFSLPASAWAAVTVQPGTLPAPQVGVAYNQTVTASGGSGTYRYFVSANRLPDGLVLDSATGAISGTPREAGAANFTITAEDDTAPNDGGPFSGDRAYTFTVADPNCSFNPGSLPDGYVGTPYRQAMNLLGCTGPYRNWNAHGLPAGLSMDAAGVISGTPTQMGSFSVTVSARDSSTGSGPFTIGQLFALQIFQPRAILASISFTSTKLGVGSTGTLTIDFTNPNSTVSPAIAPMLVAPTLVTPTNGLLGGTCGASAAISGNTVNFNAFSIPPGGCTAIMNFTGTTAGASLGFTLGAFTPSGWATTPATAGSGFAVAPTITGLSPATGPVSQVVTVSGTGFSTTPGNNTVMFGTLAGAVTAASATSLTVTAPSSGAGTVPVTVTVNGQTSTDNVSYTFQTPPVAADLNGIAVPHNSNGTAIDLNSSITGVFHTVAIGTAPTKGTIALAGTVVTYTPAAGAFGADSFTYMAANSAGTSAPATVSLTIAPPPPPVAADLNGVSVPYNSNGITIDLTRSITGTFNSFGLGSAATKGSVTLNTGTGVATYSPVAGAFGADSFTYFAAGPGGTSAPATVRLTIGAPTMTITPSAGPLPNGTTGTAYTALSFAGVGGSTPYGYLIIQGSLPLGMSLSTGTGLLSGTPTKAGPSSFTIRATDNNGFTVDQSYSIAVADPTVSITAPGAGALPAATGGSAYSQSFTATGGQGPHSFAIVSGSLPAGMTLSTDGILSGTPTSAGPFNFAVTASDSTPAGSGGPFTSAPAGYSLTVKAPGLTMTPPAGPLPNGTTGAAYTALSFAAGGGGSPYDYSIASGSLPPGMNLNASGVLSGTPAKAGPFSFTIRATDNFGFPVDQSYSIAIADPSVSITSPGAGALPAATGGSAYSQTFTATGGQGPHRFTMTSGSLPAGLSLTSAGVLSGTPTVAGTFGFTLTASDTTPPGDGGPFTSAPAGYSLTVAAPTISLSPAAGALPSGTGGVAYSQTVAATGGTAPYGFSVSAGALPAGLGLDADGKLSGTPGEAGSFNLTVTAKDAHGFAGTQAYTLAISAPVPVAGNISVDLLAGTSATVNLTAGASGGPFTAAAIVAAPAAANGTASVTGSGGAYDLTFTATATASGAVAVSYTLSNKWGVSAPATATFNVAARPDPARDREVTGLVTAQAEAARRFATAQIGNFNGRLEQLHNEGDRRTGSANIQLGVTRPRDARKPLPYAEDGTARSGTTLGFPMDRLTGSKDASAGDGGNASAAAFWAGGFVNFGQRDNGGIDLKQTLAGVSGGVDYRFSPRFVGGIGFGYGRDSADIGDNGTTSRAHAISIAAYGSYSPIANVFIDGLFGYSRLDFDSRRFVTDTGDFADGRRGGQQLFGSLTAAYEHRRDGWLLSPYGRLELSRSRLDAFAEAGAGPYNLAFGAQSLSTIAGVLGLRAEYAMPMSWGVLTPRARLEYTHDFSGSSRASMGYADLGNGLPYGFDIDPLSRDHLGLGLGFDIGLDNGWLLGFDYGTALGTDGKTQDHTLGAKIGARW